MSITKRCISLLLVLCLVLSAAPVTVHAVTASGTCGENLTWTLSDDGVLTISGTGPMTDYTSYNDAPWYRNRSSITSVLIGNSVTTISDAAFFDCDSLSSVEIPDSVTTIGKSAFNWCDNLTSVDMGNNVSTIGAYAFHYCRNLTSMRIPDGVTTIGEYAFDGCVSLPSIGIPDSVTTIGEYAFRECASLNTVTIGNGVTTIGKYAFSKCVSLISMEIPVSVTTIGDMAFYGCNSLVAINVNNNNSRYSSDARGVLFDKLKKQLICAPGGISGSYTIPDSVTSIKNHAFARCTNLTNIAFGKNVTTIDDYAFCDCDSLISVDFGNSVTAIGYEAFRDCDSLISVDFGNSVTTTGSYAFFNCDSLISVDFGNSVTTIDEAAFRDCDSLSSVTIGNNITTIGYYAFEYCSGLNSVIIGNSVTTIRGNAFSWSGMSEITFTGDAPNITANAFDIVVATAYYPANNPTWTSDKLRDYGGTITWVPYYPKAEITTSIHNYSADDLILIYPMDPKSVLNLNTTLSDVTVTSSLGESVPPKGGFFIHRADASAQDMVFSKNGYRDYVLPAEVTRTMRGEDGIAYTLTAHMHKDQKDGKPYISTVFGRESDGDKTYTDLYSNPLIVKEGSGCDIIVTAVGFGDQEVTYYLAQDSKRKVSSSTGVFENELLYTVFDDTSTVYAYAVGSDGRMAEPFAIRINREEDFDLEEELGLDSEISLLGKDFFKIEISDDIPLLGGMELDMSAFTIPVGVSVEGDEMKISLGVDLFSGTNSGEGYKWKTFKDLVIKHEEDNTEDIDAFFKDYDKNYGKSWKKSEKANKINVNILGFVEGKWIDGEFVIKEGQVNLGGSFKFQYNAQGAVWVVPVYGSVEAGADLSVGGKVTRFLPDEDIPFEFTMLLNVAPKAKGGAGAGIKGAVSAGLYVEANLPLMIAFQEEHFTLDVDGEIGVEGELFLLHGKKALLEGTNHLIDWYYGTSDSPSAVSNVTNQLQTITTVVPRDYAKHTSDWMGDRGPALSIQSMGTKTTASRGVTFRELQNSIFSNSQPQLVTVGDQMLLVWVEDDADRDTYNRMRLVYSVYDPQDDTWSEPQPVWNDGHNDGYPRLVSDGSQAYVLWQKVNTTLTAENTTDIDATIENAELCLARFDADTGNFADVQMLTENDLYEYSHNVVLENGEPVVYWAAAEENAMNTSGSNALYHWMDGIASVLAQDLNYVLSIDACDGNVTYVADADGDLSSVEDVTATTISDSGTEVFDNSELGTAVTYAGYAPFEGESVLFLSDMRNVYYNHNGEVKSVLEESRTMDGNLNIVETDEGTTIIWTETVDGWNEIFAVVYKDGEWSAPFMISENGELLTKISATGYDGKLFGVCNTNAVTYDEATGEYAKGETNLTLFQTCNFSDIALANYLNINENALEAGIETNFNVTVYNNGTKSVDEVTFTVTDTLGTESVQIVAVNIPSGGSETVALTYRVPDNYTTTTLTVTAAIADADVNTSDNTMSRTIGNPDLTVTETAVELLNDGYKITAVVENGSLVDAENVTLSAYADEENAELLRFETIGTISRENYAIAELLVKDEALSYSENGTAKLYLKLDADGDEASNADNAICVVVSKMAETVCMHPVTEQIAGLEPTCTEPGYEAYEICAACKETIGEFVEIPALGHDWDEGIVTVEPTEEAEGVMTYTCCVCFETRIESIPALEHEHIYVPEVTDPTCTEQGYTTYTCRCGDSYVSDYVDALGHSFTDYVSDGNATCTQDGTRTAVCDRCDATDTVIDEGSARGHDFTEWTVIQKPTATSEGLEFRYCLICGIEETRSVACLENPFTDVPEGSFYYDPVMWAVKNGITNGATPTTFNPNGTCLRAHVVTFLHRAAGNPEPTTTKNPFTDVKSSDFFYQPVLWAVEKGITNGTSATTFGSYANCNRAAVVTFLWRASGSPEPESTDNPFVDVKTTDFFYKPVLWAVENGITNGVDATHFGPATDCNRAQVVTFLYRAAKINNQKPVGPTEPEPTASELLYSVYEDHVEITGYSGSAEEIVIPAKIEGLPVTVIGSYAFALRKSLVRVCIPDSVTTIDNFAFIECTNLTSVDIPRGLISIGADAFRDCSSLTSIVIPDSVTSISSGAFFDCASLTGIHVDENNPSYSSDDQGVLFDKDKTELIQAPGAITTYIIPDGVTSVGAYSFRGCSSLTSIIIPDSVSSIGYTAFYECSSLTGIIIPDGVTSIGDHAFCACSNLISVEMPDGMTVIGTSVFERCDSLRDLKIPDSVTTIGDFAFYSCELSSLEIPDGVTHIGEYAFAYNEGLNSVKFRADAPAFALNVFHNVTATAYYPADNDTWTEDVMQNYGGNITWVPYDPNNTFTDF